MEINAETQRLAQDKERKAYWRKWGPYLSERQWGTIREDYSHDGQTWTYFTYEQAQYRTYRWGEDGIGGICDNHQRLCFSFSFWNEKDPFLKERLFGLTGPEGNHGEDVKEIYYFLDNTPTHSYMKYLYKYPQDAFPYSKLREENSKRTVYDYEYELVDTGIFQQGRYFDIFIEYAKENHDTIFIRLTAHNRGDQPAPLHVVPTLWFRNTWNWEKDSIKPQLERSDQSISAKHEELGQYFLHFDQSMMSKLLFTENETNFERLEGTKNATSYVKDAFHHYVINSRLNGINPQEKGTKAGLHYSFMVPSNQSIEINLVLTTQKKSHLLSHSNDLFSMRQKEADEFYNTLCCPKIPSDEKMIQRQAFAGLLWNKQFYHYVVETWLAEKKRLNPPNRDWLHLYNDDVLSVPDKWEYPSFFSWDTAFHCVALAMVDPEFAKRQLTLLTREWYMHPNGQLPASEWNFDDVNPPVHAWAIWRVYKIEQKIWKKKDIKFLESVFQKLLLNFTWWVNRKDSKGKNIFQGGFLGLDNISVFNRSEKLPAGWTLYQSDATSWMGMYCLNMLAISLELAQHNPAYEDMASKFFEHFLYIASAINSPKEGLTLWHEEEGFYYDFLYTNQKDFFPLKVRSLVGLIPLFAVITAEDGMIKRYPDFQRRLEWFLKYRTDLCLKLSHAIKEPGQCNRRLLAIVSRERLQKLLIRMLDEKEFLSSFGIRSLSKYHMNQPFRLKIHNHEEMIDYEPAESTSRMFGGNSNWRGPIWLPLNMLIIESLQKYHHYYGDSFQVECPTGSGIKMNLKQVAAEISKRLLKIFQKNEKGARPVFGGEEIYHKDPNFNPYILFYEYFHGDNGAGIGASHQTGWTALIAKLIQQLGENI